MPLSGEEDSLLINRKERMAVISLNRGKALNATTADMLQQVIQSLIQWEKEGNVDLILINSLVPKAFTSGGDIVQLLKDRQVYGSSSTSPSAERMARTEVQLITQMRRMRSPIVCLVDGICMGAGASLFLHSDFRIASSGAIFAMPETGIGFFPDAGSSFLLPQLTGNLGIFLALTGYRLRGQDVLRSGIATHFVPHDRLSMLQQELLSLPPAGRDCRSSSISNSIARLITRHQDCEEKDPLPQPLSQTLHDHADLIQHAFAADTVEQVIHRLHQHDSVFARQQVQRLSSCCPTSLKVTLKQMQVSKNASLHDCLQLEYQLALQFYARSDFYEGVRALLVDRSNDPKWTPASLSQVTIFCF